MYHLILFITNMPAPPSQNYPVAPLPPPPNTHRLNRISVSLPVRHPFSVFIVYLVGLNLILGLQRTTMKVWRKWDLIQLGENLHVNNQKLNKNKHCNISSVCFRFAFIILFVLLVSHNLCGNELYVRVACDSWNGNCECLRKKNLQVSIRCVHLCKCD